MLACAAFGEACPDWTPPPRVAPTAGDADYRRHVRIAFIECDDAEVRRRLQTAFPSGPWTTRPAL
jgi:hypothetical protein